MKTGLAVLILVLIACTGCGQLETIDCELPPSRQGPQFQMGDSQDGEPPFEAKSEHYRVESELSQEEAEWTAHLLELAYPKFIERFECYATPPEGLQRFQVIVHATRGGFERAVTADSLGETDPRSSVAAFTVQSGRAHVYRNTFPEENLRILLFMASQQFYYYSICGGRGFLGEIPGWLTTGVSHDLERGRLEGDQLELGVADAVYFHRFWGRALKAMKDPDFDLHALLFDRTYTDRYDDLTTRGLGLALVTYFREGHRPDLVGWFRDLERALSSRIAPKKALRDRLREEDLTPALIDHVERNMNRVLALPRGEWTRAGKSTVTAKVSEGIYVHLPIARLKGDSAFSLEFRIEQNPTENGSFGVALGNMPMEEYDVLVVTQGGRGLYFIHRDGMAFTESQYLKLEGDILGKTFRLSYDAKGELRVSIGEKAVLARRVPVDRVSGVLGLYAEERSSKTPRMGSRELLSYTFSGLKFSPGD